MIPNVNMISCRPMAQKLLGKTLLTRKQSITARSRLKCCKADCQLSQKIRKTKSKGGQDVYC